MARKNKTITVYSKRDKSYVLTFLSHVTASQDEIVLAIGNRTDSNIKRVHELYFWEVEE